MDSAPEITDREAQPYAGISASVTMATLGSVADRVPALFGWLGAAGIEPDGPPFFRYHVIDMARQMVVEVGVPVRVPVAVPSGEVSAGTLPAGRYAVMTHTGAPDTLADATSVVLDWAAGHDLTWDMTPEDDGEHWGCRIESYLTDPAHEPDMSKWQTRLAFRLSD